MDFAKPKVTIDLEEYNFLKNLQEELDQSDSPEDVYQRALGILIDMMPNTASRIKFLDMFKGSMKQAGYRIAHIPPSASGRDSRVLISRIEKREHAVA